MSIFEAVICILIIADIVFTLQGIELMHSETLKLKSDIYEVKRGIQLLEYRLREGE